MFSLEEMMAQPPPSPYDISQRCRELGLSWRETAVRLDVSLRVAARFEGALHRVQGEGLASLAERDGLIRLGYSCLGDYARERLGMETRRAQDLACTHRRLRDFPAFAKAYRDGRIGYSKVRLLVRQVAQADEAEWVQGAETMTVRALDAALRKAHPDKPVDEDEPASGRWIQADMPVEHADILEHALELAARLNATEPSSPECLESLLGEAMATELGVLPHPVVTSPTRRVDFKGRSQSRQQRLERETEGWKTLDWSVPCINPIPDLDISGGTDPHEVDAILQRTNRLSQRVRSWIMRLLGVFDETAYACALHFAGTGHYARERLDLSPASACRLIAIDRDLRHCPRIAEAFLDGLISQSHVAEICRVVLPRTESAWIEHAKSVPVRRLRDDVRREMRSPVAGLPPTSRSVAAAQTLHVSQPVSSTEGCCTVVSAAVSVALSEVTPTCAPEPLDNPVRRVRLWLPDDMVPLWDDVRHYIASIDGWHRTTADTLAIVARMFVGEWARVAVLEARLHPIQDRDGWSCAVPHCTRRANLEDHHIIFRSHGGDNSKLNRLPLCGTHHRKAVHQGYIVLRGEAPDNLYWLLGVREDGSAHMIIDGDRIVHAEGFPLVSTIRQPSHTLATT